MSCNVVASIVGFLGIVTLAMSGSAYAQDQTDADNNWLTPAQIDILNSDECAEYPEFAGCQEEFYLPDCVKYPDIAACSPGSDYCQEHPEAESCITDGLVGGPILPSDGNSEDAGEEGDTRPRNVRIIDEFLDGISGDDEEDFTDAIPDPEDEEETECIITPPLIDCGDIIIDLDDTEEENAPLDEKDTDDPLEEILEEVDRELEAERDCANIARLSALNERMRFETDRADQTLRIAVDRNEAAQSILSFAQDRFDSITVQSELVQDEILFLELHGRKLTEELIARASVILQLETSAQSDLIFARDAVFTSQTQISEFRSQIVDLAHRQIRNKDEISVLQGSCD